MNRTRILKSSLLIVVILAVLIGAVMIAQGTALDSLAAANDVTRQPRPHPKSHIKIADATTLIEPDDVTLYPRPHPKSHLKITGPGSMLYPRPHPTSHLSVAATPIEPDSATRSPRPHPKSHIEILTNLTR
jgi:hypothetical protein